MNMQAALVYSILNKWRSYEWSVQGFGMLRTKLAGVGRIHVWDSRLRAPAMLSDIHAHPWDLMSSIISGELINQRLQSEHDSIPIEGYVPYWKCGIATGEGGGLVGEPQRVYVVWNQPEFYHSGDDYTQLRTEVHRSIPQDGTVTLLSRTQGPPLEKTFVYWPQGLQWQTAEPRPAQEWETERAIELALGRWSAP